MKKTCLLISALIFVNLIYVSSALTFDLKESYLPGENILGEIIGNVIEPVEKNQLELKRGDVRVPLNGDIGKIGDKEYFWALAPENETNYTLYIYNITTNVAGVVKKVDLIRNFSVSGNLTDYNVDPGFIVATKNFSVNVFLYEDMAKEINVSLVGDQILNPGDNKIDFNVDNLVGENFISLVIGKYVMPAYIIGKKNESSIVIVNPIVSLSPLKIERTISYGQRPIYTIEIKNTGNDTLDNINIEYDNKTFIVSPTKNKLNGI